MIKLHQHQGKFKTKLNAALDAVRDVLGVLPTGGGKTVVFCSMVADHVGAAAIVVHRREIVRQISVTLAAFGVVHRVIGPRDEVGRIRRRHLKKFGRSFVDQQSLVGVVSVQTMTSKSTAANTITQRWLAQVTFAVFDEGHHYVRSGLWGRAVDQFHRAKRLFVTGTPERADGKGLGAHAEGYAREMVLGPTPQWLIDNAFLSPFKYFCPDSDMDIADLALDSTGDVSVKERRKRAVASHIVGDVVRHYRQYADGLQTIVFAPDVETAEDMAAAFRLDGVKAVALSGKTDSGVRDRELDLFERCETQVLVNVDLFDEGFDVPAVVCVILARITASLGKYLQMVGRALRVMDGKEHAIVIDPVRNWERNRGLPSFPRRWTLDSRPKGDRVSPVDTIPQKICRGCTQPYDAYYALCPYQSQPGCAIPPEPEGRARPDQVDGDLFELDVAALNELYAAYAARNMTDEEYDGDLISRNVPAVGRGAARKRHRTARHRTAVLKELIGWWVGMQPAGRDLAEKQRRFYHRFRVDMATAMSLDANDTDALIATIGRRFNEDMA